MNRFRPLCLLCALILSVFLSPGCGLIEDADEARKELAQATARARAAQEFNAQVQADATATDEQKTQAALSLAAATTQVTAKTEALTTALAEADKAAMSASSLGAGLGSAIPPPYGFILAGVAGLAGGLLRARVHKSSAIAIQAAGDAVVTSIEALKAAGKLDTKDPTVASILNVVQGAAGKLLVDQVQGKRS